MSAPRVTVLMSVRDGEAHLREMLASVRAQTFADLELLVIDDGSRDATPAILAAHDDPRLRVLRQEPAGLTRSLARGLAAARGAYVARLDADDVALPERLAHQVAYLDAHPDVVLCGTWAEIVDDAGRVLERRRPPVDDEAIRTQLLWDNALFHSSWMFRADPVRDAGGYDEAVERAQDHELAWRLARRARLANVPRPLLRWRRARTAVSAAHRAAQRRSVGATSLRALTETLGAPPDEERFWRLRALWDGDRDRLAPGDARWLAGIVGRLPPALGRTVWVELLVMAAAALPREGPALLAAAWRGSPEARMRLLHPERVARVLSGGAGLRASRWLRRKLRGY